MKSLRYYSLLVFALSLTIGVEAADFGDIPASLALPAGTSVRRNAGNTGFESYTPGSGGGTPGGSNTQLQYNNSGSFGGISGATSNGTSVTLTSPKILTDVKDTNGNTIISLNPTASAVNYLVVSNVVAGASYVHLDVNGTDTNTGLVFFSKGTGRVSMHNTLGDLSVSSTGTTTSDLDINAGIAGVTDTPLTLTGQGPNSPTALFSLSNIPDSTARAVNIAGSANSTTVVPDTGTANNFLTGISANGVPSKAQPTESNILNLVSDLALKAPLASPTLTGVPLAPTASQGTGNTQIATTAYVDSSLQNFDLKNPVVAATTTVLPFSPTYANGSSGVGATLTAGVGILIIDGYTPVIGDRLLVKNQAATLQQGVYTVTTVGTAIVGYVLTRATDFNQTANILYGDSVGVLQGTVNANQQFTMNNQTAITVGTTAITFAQTSGGSQLASGNGITITGNSVAINTAVTVDISTAQTLTNKWVQPRTTATPAPGATPAVNTDSFDLVSFTSLGTAITSMSTSLTGTPVRGQRLMLGFKDDGTARAITWGASFQNGPATLLATTVISKQHWVGLIYDGTKWTCFAVDATGY